MCSDSLFAAGFSAFWHAELEAQKKRIAETPENGDNDEDAVLALPSEQVDENHVAAQQSGASEAQDPHIVAEQTQTSEQVDESNVAAQQSEVSDEHNPHVVAEQTQTSEQTDENHVATQQLDVLAEQDSRVVAEQTQTSEQVNENHVAAQQSGVPEKNNSYEEKPISHEEELRQKNEYADDIDRNTTKDVVKQAANDVKKLNGNKAADEFAKSKGYKIVPDKQKKGKPRSNTAQNKQVNDAARDEKLTLEQRKKLGKAVEKETREYGCNLDYHDIRQIACDIKNGEY